MIPVFSDSCIRISGLSRSLSNSEKSLVTWTSWLLFNGLKKLIHSAYLSIWARSVSLFHGWLEAEREWLGEKYHFEGYLSENEGGG